MKQRQKPAGLSIMILLAAAVICAAPVDAAPAKKAKKAAAAKQTIPDVPRKRAVREFTDAYQSPPGSKVVKIYHTGKFTRGYRTRGEQRVPVQVHMIALETRLTDCNIVLRDTWEVYFYRLETDWIFDGFLQVASVQRTWPKKKHPSLADAAAKKLIADGVMAQYPGARVSEVTVLSRKAAWKLCTPLYRVRSKVLLGLSDDVFNTVTTYECMAASVISLRDGSWVHDSTGCVYRGKEVPDCHIGTMCRRLRAESSIPAITDDRALSLLRRAFEDEYGLKKNNIAVEEFVIIERLPPENYGKNIPVIVRASFVIDEMKESVTGRSRSTSPVRTAYECAVHGYLIYSAGNGEWTATIDSCCPPGSGRCGHSCSSPVKGCRRLGEK